MRTLTETDLDTGAVAGAPFASGGLAVRRTAFEPASASEVSGDATAAGDPDAINDLELGSFDPGDPNVDPNLDVGAEDMTVQDDGYEITCPPTEFAAVRDACEGTGGGVPR